MSAFVKHAPKNIAACTMCFVKGYNVTLDESGKVVGGTLCSLAMKNPKRIVPDLHTVFSGAMNTFVSIHSLELADCDESDPTSALKVGVCVLPALRSEPLCGT
jgi:hypothetical protein